MSTFDLKSLVGEIDVLRSDEYAKLPGCLDGVDIPRDQLNTVIHEVLHMVIIPVNAFKANVASGKNPIAGVEVGMYNTPRSEMTRSKFRRLRSGPRPILFL